MEKEKKTMKDVIEEKRHEEYRNSPEGRMLRAIFGDDAV